MTPTDTELERLAKAARDSGYRPDSWWNFSRDYAQEFGPTSVAFLDKVTPLAVLDLLNRLRAAEREPEMVYVLGEKPAPWFKPFYDLIKAEGSIDHSIGHWNRLRELTRQPKVEGREWWLHVPTRTVSEYPFDDSIHVREVLKP